MTRFLINLIGVLVVTAGYAHACDNGTEFECENGQCIGSELICDGWWDCSNGEDETDPIACPCDGFTCADGTCISSSWECDGEADCAGGEDEHDDCPPCFHCENNPACLPASWVCDGLVDCDGGEDEIGCPCDDGFVCPSGQCIPSTWLCDQENDCGDWADEAGCECAPGEVNCGRCIPEAWWCDTVSDCPDGSDEEDCGNSTRVVTERRHNLLVKEHYSTLCKRHGPRKGLSVRQMDHKKKVEKEAWKAARKMRS